MYACVATARLRVCSVSVSRDGGTPSLHFTSLHPCASFHPTRNGNGRVAVPVSPNTKEIFTAVTPQSPSISGLTHDHPSSVAHQQRKKPDPRPPQAAGALKIALLGAHAEHGPRGALKELDQSTLLLLLLSVLCTSHLQAIPRPCGCIEQRLYSPMHIENIGP